MSLGDEPQKQPITWFSLASSLELERIQTPSSLFCGFREDKNIATIWSGHRFQIWVQIWALAQRLLSVLWCSSDHTSFRLFQKAVNCFECKINGQALDAALGQSHGCSDLQAPHAVSKSVQQLWSCTVHTARVSLCEKVQQLLCYELSLKFKKVLALAQMHPAQVCWELCLQMRGWHGLLALWVCCPAATSIVPRCFYFCWSHRLLFWWILYQ